MRKIAFFLLLPVFSFAQKPLPGEISAWEAQAKRVTIVEDHWGIPHIYGQKDADAVFGLLYVQCSQNFARIERNYLEIMGRLSEVEGEKRLYEDLQMRLIYDTAAAREDYQRSPQWFKSLLNAFADGINYYLYKHPETKPLVLQRFEPWFPLLYTDGSIAPTQTGGLTVQDLRHFYEGKDDATSLVRPELSVNNFKTSGSNGFAIAPAKTASGNAILYINPHVTFYFRTEAHLVSNEGLNAYGAVTWGQFFIYQGFNESCGWMHTSSYADVADQYLEKVEKTGNGFQYWFDGWKSKAGWKPVTQKEIVLRYHNASGSEGSKRFLAYFTHHGPVMGRQEGKWISLRENNRSLSALMQSWLRTKANGFAEFKKVMEMRSNNSNNTVFADNKGNIAYWHGNFMPRRNPKYDWSLPVDGTTPETEWQGLHTLDEIIHLYNPKSGWIQNCNSTPFTSSGESSPRKQDYPTYMAPEGQNGRALNAVRLLSKANKLTLDNVIRLGYNTYLTAFDYLLPPLFDAYANLSAADKNKTFLANPVHVLQVWNRSAAASSVATTIAVEWAFRLANRVPPARTPEAATNAVGNFEYMANRLSATDKLEALAETIRELERLYGTWQVAWGDINRYQRSATNQFSDDKPSLPVGLGPGTWGSMPSFVSRRFDTKKRYGVSGNSFIAAVEFGKKLKAKTIMTGGESFDSSSPNFTDQAEGYIEGKFKDILFYKEDVQKDAVRTYHPGE
ncbi:penicillin acylase family protein [Flavisolibacter nicotianae]|uniref:penicillin acylase family protein n=1 Tax=Flavisolibacter nicotianae TaxID=2364882 RepID=UPI000EAD3411|nr:penicillin acylase family protein [Flavisolibacter nicotianae]